MSRFFTTDIGRLRLLGFLEGLSLIFLVLIAMPLKYVWQNPMAVKVLGPIHGGLFMLFIMYAFWLTIEKEWSYIRVTLKLLIASFIPFGNFWVDHTVLKPLAKSPPS
jgi:integral membrane protein